MLRDLYAQLLDWKKEPKRKPLLIRGARQVGKTWLVEHFARSEFDNFVEINFEFQPEFKYASVDSHRPSRDVKQALDLLSKARLVNKVPAASGSGLPLEAYSNEKSFKVLLLDTGLMQAAAGISGETYLSDNLLAVYRGAVAEHYVGQQLLALLPWYREPVIHYWRREARGSEAEVDYLWQTGVFVLPIEVKAGKTGTLKSLKIFSVPLYIVEALPKLARQAVG